MDAMPKEVDQFLKASGFIEGDFVKLDPFPEQHAVSEEEAAIFDAAVGDYPMMNATATAVASRKLPDGVEYLFTAKDKPREDSPKMPPGVKPDDKKPKMPPPGEMKVYVTVVNGENPVFTKVIR